MYENGWWWHMFGMWLSGILFIAVLVLLIRWLPGSIRGLETPKESAKEILKRRYARGDIDKEEYDRKLSDLRR